MQGNNKILEEAMEWWKSILHAIKHYWARLDSKDKSDFRFPDISDGEVVLLQGICCLIIIIIIIII